MRTTSLEWALGIFLTGAGILMLVAPHQFSAVGYDALRPALPWWATGFCLCGVALLAVPVFALGRGPRLAGHTAATVALWSLARAFVEAEIWGSAAEYAVLGVATLATGLTRAGGASPPTRENSGSTRTEPAGLARTQPVFWRVGRADSLTLAMAAIALLHGIGPLALPGAYRAPAYDPIRGVAPLFGAAFLAAGAALAWAQLAGPDAEVRLARHFDRYRALPWPSQMMRFDAETYLPEDVLTKVDRMSMAHSIESRVPLLDNLVIEFASALPAAMKIKNGRRKHVLKEAAATLLPRDLLDRPKQGFGPPLGIWFRGNLRELFADTLLSGPGLARGYFHAPFVRQLVQEHVSGKRDHTVRLWQLVLFERWHQAYLDTQYVRAA